MQAVIDGKLDYTIADSVAVSLFQRVHPELAVALDISDEQPVTWFSARSEDNSLSAAMLDFFNNMNEDGTLARLEEKYLGHGNDFDYVDTRTFLRAVEIFCRTCSRCLKNTRARSTGACWRPFHGRNRTGIRRPPRPPGCAA
jgi:membrane-bound lytic murein transglycosylase MltF